MRESTYTRSSKETLAHKGTHLEQCFIKRGHFLNYKFVSDNLVIIYKNKRLGLLISKRNTGKMKSAGYIRLKAGHRTNYLL